MTRKLFVTTALPYANANFHIGHIMEYTQADIWVRYQRLQGQQVHFVGADDAHGAPIMIAAEKAGKTPQQFVGEIAAGRGQLAIESSGHRCPSSRSRPTAAPGGPARAGSRGILAEPA